MNGPLSFRSLDEQAHLVTVTVSPASTWRLTCRLEPSGPLLERGPETVRAVRDRIRGALVSSGMASTIVGVRIHVEGGRYWEGHDLGVVLALGAPDRLHDGLLGTVDDQGKVHPVVYEVTELQSPVEDLAELAPIRVDEIVRSVVVVP
jgi:hypothetical protein